MDDDADMEAEIERELEQAEQERQATAAAKRRPKLLEVYATSASTSVRSRAGHVRRSPTGITGKWLIGREVSWCFGCFFAFSIVAIG